MKLRIIALSCILLAALGAYFFLENQKETGVPSVQPRPFVWNVDMEDLAHMVIAMPREAKAESWIKREDKYWYFDYPGGPRVDMKRWGGGIPLLLSGPGAERIVVEEATSEQLVLYGFSPPTLRIDLTIIQGDRMTIEVGDATPDGRAYYIKTSDSSTVYSVHYTWYDVLARLVDDPPYPEDTSN